MLFVAGNTRQHALRVGHQYLLNNKFPIINYAVENNYQPNKVVSEYQHLISEIPDERFSLALKLSSFNFDIQKVSTIVSLAQKKNIRIFIDAEQDLYHQTYQDVSSKLMFTYNNSQSIIFKTYQLYRRDSLNYLSNDLDFCYRNNLFLGAKLVRGAYWNTEQTTGNLFLEKTETDNNYNQGILKVFTHPYLNQKVLLATHNKVSSGIGQALSQYKNIFEFAHLQGMRESYYQDFTNKHSVYVYIPYGPYKEMIPYLGRRLYENIQILSTLF